MIIYNYVIVSLLFSVTFPIVLDQTDLTSPESTDFSTTGWEYQDGSPKTTTIGDCSTYLLKIDDQESIKKSYSINTRHFANIELDFNLYFPSFVDNMITIKLNSIIVYQNTILLAGITTSSELCSDSSSQHYQLTPSLSQVWSQRSVLLEIQYQQINGNAPSSYLGIRDIHILTDSDQNNDQCPYDYPLRSGDDNECAIQCKSVGEQIGGSKLNRCISPSDTNNIQLITPNWSNNVNLDLLSPDPNYLDMQKFQFFEDSFNQASYIIKDSAAFESGHKMQVVMLMYLFGSWSNGSYLKFCVNNGGSSIDLFQITSSGTAFTVSTGATVSVVTIVQQDLSTISAGRVMIVAEGQVGVPGIWEYGIIQNLIGSTTSYAIGNVAIYRAQQLTQLCASFVQTNYCISCINPYYAYEGYCIKVCPKYSIISTIDRNCTSYIYTETTLRYPALISNYIGNFKTQKYFAPNINSNDISSYFTSIPITASTLNYLNSQKFSIIQKKKLLGGYNSWGSGTYTKSLSGLSTHTQIRLFVTLYFIDNWYPKEKIIITIVTNQYSESIEGLVGQQITGNPALDYKKTVFYRLSHSSTSLTISFQCKQETNGDASKSSCGISDLYLMLDNVLSTTSTVCTAAQYLDFYTNTCQNCDVSCNGIGCQLFPEMCKCDSTCQTCTGSLGSNCSSCSSLKHWLVGGGNSCNCDSSNHYQVAVNGQSTCSLNTGCHYSCQKCFQANSPTHCSSCPTSTFRFLTTNMECKCQYGYYDAGTQICLVESCHYSCDTCSAYGLHNYCLTCPDQTTSHRLLTPENTCTCDYGFIDIEGEQICRASVSCHYSCGTCSGLQNYECITCLSHQITHRTQAASTCPCDTGYIGVTNSSNCSQNCDPTCLTCTALGANNCLTCSGSLNRKAGSSNDCICKDGYQDVSGSCNQIPCHYSCQLCSVSNSETSCITCPDQGITHRISGTNNDCPCETGYLSISNEINCQIQCHYSCLTCSLPNLETACLTCPDQDASHRIVGTNNDCPCETGYLSISDQVNCQVQCHYSCLTCSLPNLETACLTCPDQDASHRIVGTNNDCPCETGYLSISDQVNCQVQCHYSCLTCSQASLDTACLTCPDQSTSHRIVGTNNDCPCETGYLSISDQVNCQVQCHYSCLTCSQASLDIACLTCPDQSTSHRIVGTNNDCPCETGYSSILDQVNCQIQCHYSCLTCSQASLDTVCLTCPDQSISHRIVGTNNDCPCQTNYFDVPNQEICEPICHYTCLTCSAALILNSCLTCDSAGSNRIMGIDNSCVCQYQFTEVFGQSLCEPICHSTCLTCSGILETQCLSCSGEDSQNRTLVGNQCICQEGYVEVNSLCQIICMPLCQTCLSMDKCISCKINTNSVLSNNYCQCQKGKYEVSGQCKDCPENCVNCLNQTFCTECDSNLNRKLSNGNCICESQYREVNGQCLSCNIDDGWLDRQCQKIDSSDGVYTYGEKCDDGNTNLRDGCANSQISSGYFCINVPMTPSICAKCLANCDLCETGSFCTKCLSGYQADSYGRCMKCGENCSECNSAGCLNCIVKPNNIDLNSQNTKCYICEDLKGVYSSPTDKNTCLAQCGDSILVTQLNEECDDGNLIDNDGCSSTCQIEIGYECYDNVCTKRLPPVPELFPDIKQTNIAYNSFRLYTLNYSQFIFNDNRMKSRFTIQIENKTENVDYKLDITENVLSQNLNNYCNYSILISLELLNSFESDQIQINFNSIDQIYTSKQIQQEIVNIRYPIEDYYFQSILLIAATQSVSNFNIIALYILVGFVGLSVLLGGLDTFWNLLDIIQLLSYIQYIDTRYPYNLKTFLDVFSFGQLSFLNNLFNIQFFISSNIEYQELIEYTPMPIYATQIDSTLFVLNASSTLTAFIIIFLLQALSKTLQYLSITIFDTIYQRNGLDQGKLEFMYSLKKKILKFTKKYSNSFYYNVIIRTHMSTVFDLTFATFLQLQMKYSDLISLIPQISYIMAVASIILQLLLFYFYISKLNLKYSTEQFQLQYGDALLDTLKVNQLGRLPTYYNVFLLIKRCIYMALLITLVSEPFIQTLCISMLNIGNIVFLLYVRPLDSKFEFLKQIQCEILLFLLHLQICIFVIDDEIHIFNEAGRTIIGWICMGEISLIILIQLVVDIIQQFRYLYENVKFVRNGLNQIIQKLKPKEQINQDPTFF